MKKVFFILTLGLSILLLTQCNQKSKSRLVGVWKLQQMDVNGTTIAGSSLGNWMWEFNDEGGYLSDIAGAKEKGIYKLTGNQITIKPIGAEKWPERSLNIVKLDSAELFLEANGEKNKSSLKFLRLAGSPIEKD